MAQNAIEHDLISAIYECACVSQTWEPALEVIRDALDATTASLRVRRMGGQTRDYLTSVGAICSTDLTRDWECRQARIDLDISCQLNEIRVCRWAEADGNNAIVNDLRALGVAETLFYCFASTDRTTFTLSLTRGEDGEPFGQDEFAKVRQLGEHFRHAVRLREKHIHGGLTGVYQAEALNQLGIAGLLVDRFGAVLPLNQQAIDLLSDGDCLRLSHNSLAAAFRAGNTELQATLKRVFAHRDDQPVSYALALERRSERRPLGVVVHSTRAMCPLSNRMENCALIFARDPETAFATDPLLLQKLFSFTPAEANLAIGLAKGQPLREIECSLNIRHNTARAHLRAMFIKADVTRQAELVSLLTNSVAPLGSRQRQKHQFRQIEAVAA